jgi:hypothetical protein
MDEIKMIAAITHIRMYHLAKGDCITMIEFEDGSGYKFNYRTIYNKTPQHVNLIDKI